MSSTAPVASQPENDSASISGSDSKKRNKLGYHRTAVACGHCRRRKIRCIPSSESSESKCQNCIRLKKECHFFPVDQNGANTRKSRSDSRAEPSAEESTLSRTSTSPDHPASATSDSFDVPFGRRTSPGGTWADGSGLVAPHPGGLGSLHNLDQQDWNPSPAHGQIQDQYSQPNPHPHPHPHQHQHPPGNAGMYWIQGDDHPVMNYQQQQYNLATTSGPFTQEPHVAFHNAFGETRHSIGRQSFSGILGSTVNQSNSYRHYNHTTFPEIERSMTIPVSMYNHSGINEVLHSSPPMIAGPGQFVYDQTFAHQIPDNQQPWFSSASPQSGFSPHYLPTQQDRKYSQFSS